MRVVCAGVPIEDLLADPQNPKWNAYSVELCGGPRLESTAQMGKFVICSENAIAKGVRRIQAVTGQAASEALALGAELTERVSQLEALLSPADAGSAWGSSWRPGGLSPGPHQADRRGEHRVQPQGPPPGSPCRCPSSVDGRGQGAQGSAVKGGP